MAWVKGQSGNPDGSPKGKPWAGAIRRAIAESDREALLDIAKALVAKAAEGDLQAIKELGDRLDGKPHQTSDVNVTASIAEVLGSLPVIDDAPGTDSTVA